MDAKPHHWLIDKLLPQVPTVIVLGAIMWTRLAVLESKIEEKWAYAMDERMSIKAELSAMKTQLNQQAIDITTIKSTMQFWQEWNTQQRQRQQQRQNGGAADP